MLGLVLLFLFLGQDGDHASDILTGLANLGGVLQGRNRMIELHGVEVVFLEVNAVAKIGDGHLTYFGYFHFLLLQ